MRNAQAASTSGVCSMIAQGRVSVAVAPAMSAAFEHADMSAAPARAHASTAWIALTHAVMVASEKSADLFVKPCKHWSR